jgi:hypothetical protein
LVPFVFESQRRVKGFRQRAHSIQPYLKRFETLHERQGVEVILEGLSVDLSGDPFNSPEDVRGLAEMNQMGEMVLMGPAWKAHIDLQQIKLELRVDEEIDPYVHTGSVL